MVGADDTVGGKLGAPEAATEGVIDIVGRTVGFKVGFLVGVAVGIGTVGAKIGGATGAGAVVGIVPVVTGGSGSKPAGVNGTDGAVVLPFSFCAWASTTDGFPARRKIIARYGDKDTPDRNDM